MLFEHKCQTVALVGLGGVGKTQIALDIAYWAKKEQPQFSVFWVPVLSHASFEKAFRDIAKELNIHPRNKDEDIKESVQSFLSSKESGSWLLIVDNADDKDLMLGSSDDKKGLADYLPQSESGLTLFTTRVRDIALEVAEDNLIELLAMNKSDATSLLEKSLHRKKLLVDDTAIGQLLEFLTYLPLAITQAAAYLNRNLSTSIASYLRLLRSTEHSAVELLSREFRDTSRYKESQNAVARTWLVSFEQIQKSDSYAAEILYFISRIEPKAIPRSILPQGESDEKTEWAIGTLCSYSFLTARNDDEAFDMHSLVYLATRLWIKRQLIEDQVITTAVLHLVNVFPSTDYTDRDIRRQYMPHSLRVLNERQHVETNEESDLWLYCGQCYLEEGRAKDAIFCFEKCFSWRKKHCLEDENSLLTSQHELARAYHADGRVKEAIKLLENVVEIGANTPNEEHPDRLTSQYELAKAYRSDWRVKEAIKLLENIMEIQANILNEEHPHRLTSQHELASAYRSDGRVKEAIKLLENIVEIQANILNEEHPHRLTSQHELASAYRSDGRVKEAIKLLENIVDIQANILNEEHPHRLTSQHELASAYLLDGRVKEAIKLLENVVQIKTNVLDEDHPEQLRSQHELARAYHADGRVKEAIKLLENVVQIKTNVLDEDHPEQLISQHELASAYRSEGRVKEAIKLLEHVVERREITLNKTHPYRLGSQHLLRLVYLEDGQVKESIKLLQQVVEIEAEILDEGHPDRLASQEALLDAYEALKLLES
ncbi:phosphorylase superfamily protein [Colletotrichum truncatum]|uniref:Phosphorylase superfamily protein n=1 Tax=Colletotrichum truncatum TaxID=5467 RepID=A0ACC3Z285_COLTU|nr:phosphorylase superfamily protein [Colletotrichum truncatum]KAF6786550.1 phosphorylase superfamily protein [Colletotrichum truncatum]